jgi:ABC-type uncharacterized transport system involved in gliding motility auxiliary subunit
MASDRSVRPAKGRTAANSLVTAAAVIASLVGVNLIGHRVFGRVDLTEDRIYKLSQVSKDTMKNLPDRLLVKAFISDGLQPPLNTTAQYARDLLDEYASASGGKFVWEAIDPTGGKDKDEKDKHKDELTKYKVQKIALERISDTKLEIGSENYLGIGFAYGDQVESIPSLTSTEGLEFQITSIVRRMVASKKKKIGFTTSEGELTQQNGLQILNQFMQDYEVTPVTLDKPIADDIDAIVMAGPKQPVNEKSKYFLDQFLMKGKSVAIFQDGMTIEQPKGMQLPGQEQPRLGRGNDTALAEMLEKYGLKLHDDMVLDRQNVVGLVPVNGQMRPANYPAFVAVIEDGFDKASALTSKVKALVAPFPSSVELTGDLKDGKGEVKATPIARTSKASWRATGFFIYNPPAPPPPPQTDADKGPFVLGYALEGKFKSAFPGGPPGGAPGESTPESAGALLESKAPGRLVVVGSSGVLADEYLRLSQYIPAYGQNMLFAINTIDWLVRDESLVTLRAKGTTQRPFTVAPESKMMFWRYAIEFGVSLALIGVGLLLWLLRGARRARASA